MPPPRRDCFTLGRLLLLLTLTLLTVERLEAEEQRQQREDASSGLSTVVSAAQTLSGLAAVLERESTVMKTMAATLRLEVSHLSASVESAENAEDRGRQALALAASASTLLASSGTAPLLAASGRSPMSFAQPGSALLSSRQGPVSAVPMPGTGRMQPAQAAPQAITQLGDTELYPQGAPRADSRRRRRSGPVPIWQQPEELPLVLDAVAQEQQLQEDSLPAARPPLTAEEQRLESLLTGLGL